MVTIETARVMTVSRGQRSSDLWCRECGEPMRMVTLEEAMALTGATSREIHRHLEAGDLHFAETRDGHLRLCLFSLCLERH